MSGITTDQKNLALIFAMQKGEITEYLIYTKIAATTKDPHNHEVLVRIAAEELTHYGIWKRYTKRDVAPDMLRVWYYYLIARLLGMTFAIKLMEGIEKRAQSADRALPFTVPEIDEILKNEEIHERELIALIDEERLKYVGSVVLGLNDALVEFTGTLAGLTFALQNTQIIAVVGLVMGVAASLSMGASEYLSQRSDGGPTDPVKASVYTGFTYIVTVALLILPFLLFSSPFIALMLTLLAAVMVIFVFTFYVSVAKDLPFYRRFVEMAAISLGIAAISFLIGIAIRTVLNVNV
ncbi:MAG: rubrerythrin family protein [Methanomicrobiales archaeon HGW-Methanomicrobiales-1]|jgi:VIT1/CCC1 family predicted Fe2+/Mn2+ transporter|nr:MAG: rubrerythrin family protein [Methanomicrobiales archaeon HGW-Methanomicrobiales-1]